MITTKKKICKECNTEQYIFSRGMCKFCAGKNPKEKSGLKDIPKKSPFGKPTGELVLFQSIWATRKHNCAVCGTDLKVFDVWFFSHILSKGSFPRFRLYEKNIVIKCRQHHHEWGTKSNKDLLKKDGRWLPMIELHDTLIQEYYERNTFSKDKGQGGETSDGEATPERF